MRLSIKTAPVAGDILDRGTTQSENITTNGKVEDTSVKMVMFVCRPKDIQGDLQTKVMSSNIS